MLRLNLDELIVARNSLIAKSLIAFDGFMFQVLSLPDKPVLPRPRSLHCQQDFERDDPLTIRKIIQQSLNHGGETNNY